MRKQRETRKQVKTTRDLDIWFSPGFLVGIKTHGRDENCQYVLESCFQSNIR